MISDITMNNFRIFGFDKNRLFLSDTAKIQMEKIQSQTKSNMNQQETNVSFYYTTVGEVMNYILIQTAKFE